MSILPDDIANIKLNISQTLSATSYKMLAVMHFCCLPKVNGTKKRFFHFCISSDTTRKFNTVIYCLLISEQNITFKFPLDIAEYCGKLWKQLVY